MTESGVPTDGAEHRQPRRPRIPLSLQIVLGMLLGLLVGPLLGAKAARLGEVGGLVIQLIKATAAPLLFLAIVQALLKTEVRGRGALRLFFWASLNASIALFIGISLSNLFGAGHLLQDFAKPSPEALAGYANKNIDFIATLKGLTPQSLVTPFAENLVLSIVLIAVLCGAGLRRVKNEQRARGLEAYRAVEDALDTLLSMMETVLGWVIKLVPFAVFMVVAKSVGEHGFAPLAGLAAYVGLGLGGLLLHVVVTYQIWLVFVARMNLLTFWRAAKEPIVYAAGANSSLATLPITLNALRRLKVSPGASALGACVGTNFNNDGIILYEGMALLFVAQASGIDLSVSQQLLLALTCLLAAMGVAGVPEAGFISLALVLNSAGLPLELLPLLLTVDWLIARGRSVTNVLSDMLLSILVDRGMPRESEPSPRPSEPQH